MSKPLSKAKTEFTFDSIIRVYIPFLFVRNPTIDALSNTRSIGNMALNLFGNLLEAVFLKQQCCDGNATTINAKDHDVLCAFSFVHPDSRAYVWWNEKPGSGRAGHDGVDRRTPFRAFPKTTYIIYICGRPYTGKSVCVYM